MSDLLGDKEVALYPFRWGGATDIGLVRQDNQDAMAIEPEAGLFLVVDGMGGHRGGDLAARMVAEDLPPMVENGLGRLPKRSPRAVRRLLKGVVIEHSRHLEREGQSESGQSGMGATMVLVLFAGGRVFVVNVGDSRVYRLRKGRLVQLTVDHSVIAELLQAGRITPEDVPNHCDQGVVTQHMGMPEKVEPLVRSLALKPGDRFLLCSDGLTDMVDDADISRVLATAPDPQQASETLVRRANEAGGFDNVTAVVVTWMPDR